jgi:hypothetical protein
MRQPFPLLCLPLFCAAAAAQDVLYYKFDDAGGPKVVNFASTSGVAPAQGTLLGGLTPAFIPGLFGAGALSGGTSTGAATSVLVDTGWIPSWTNASVTMAFFMRQRVAPPSTSYFFYHGPSGFRMFTGGVAARGLLLRNLPADIPLTTDVQTLAATAWLHVGLVIDATALTATWYLNGVAQAPIPITGGSNIAANTTTIRACGFSTNGGVYDIDDFRLSLRAASATEIGTWATRTSPADGPYGAGCFGGGLASTGNPQLGNAAYGLSLTGNPGNVYVLALGASRLSLGGVPLPLNLGLVLPSLAGCMWESSTNLLFAGVCTGATTPFALPLPLDVSLDGATLWAQAITVFGTQDQSTNAFAIGLGQ